MLPCHSLLFNNGCTMSDQKVNARYGISFPSNPCCFFQRWGHSLLIMQPLEEKNLPSGKLTQTLPNRGWKISFHYTYEMFRVYVNLRESSKCYGFVQTQQSWGYNQSSMIEFLIFPQMTYLLVIKLNTAIENCSFTDDLVIYKCDFPQTCEITRGYVLQTIVIFQSTMRLPFLEKMELH